MHEIRTHLPPDELETHQIDEMIERDFPFLKALRQVEDRTRKIEVIHDLLLSSDFFLMADQAVRCDRNGNALLIAAGPFDQSKFGYGHG